MVLYIVPMIINTKITNNIFLSFFFNSLKIGLRVVKKNPIRTVVKNLGNLYKLFQKFDIIFYYIL